MGRLTGVMDDRGKYIYIAPEELKEMAKWIKRCGRVSKPELSKSCVGLLVPHGSV
eukprot:m.88559 g.88559  ORF g.88559 m.88559 type:complete len:55 (-) comp14946_c1_seq3:45-209(-)